MARMLLDDYYDMLTEWEVGFMESVATQHYEPTDKQKAVLYKIIAKCGLSNQI